MIIWLASYPRSGSTFFRSVLKHYFDISSYSAYGSPRDIGSNDALASLVGHKPGQIGGFDLKSMRASDQIIFIKTHGTPDEFVSRSDTIFYIERDGRDASASYLKYLVSVGRDTNLREVLTGSVGFGFWGGHIIRWHDSSLKKFHRFKFEEITANPESLANQLSDYLDLPRSFEPFPSLETFRSIAPSFFGSGRSGSFKELFTPEDLALFGLYSGPAMCISGYCAGTLTSDERTAYALFCDKWAEWRRKSDQLTKYEETEYLLRAELQSVKQVNSKLSDEHARQKKAIKQLKDELDATTRDYNRLARWTGRGVLKRVARRLRF